MIDWKDGACKLGVAAVSALFIAAVAYLDFITSYQTAVSLLYIVPLYLVGWFSWGPVAILAAVMSGLSDTIFTTCAHQQCQAVTVLNSAIQSIFFVIFVSVLVALKKAHLRLEQFSKTDPLTELANGRYFAEVGGTEIHRVVRYKRPFSLIYMDMDNFKSINDTAGHGFGDTFLREITAQVKATIRKTDTMARLGGDEFAILMPETDAVAVRLAVARIQKSLLDIRMPDGKQATFSIGVITNPGHPCTFDEMIKAADALMYEAKRAGKNTVRAGILPS